VLFRGDPWAKGAYRRGRCQFKPNKIVGITSSLPNEGKSTISASLGQLCAYGARVVLIDCVLRKRSLSRELAPDAAIGIIEVIGGESTVDEAIWSDPQTRLAFLPLVVKTRLTHASEVLAQARDPQRRSCVFPIRLQIGNNKKGVRAATRKVKSLG
jgi:Mrp family chromosome partitioning ATPase